MHKILVVDDHAVVSRGIIQILTETERLDIECDQAATGQEALRKLSANRYQALLLDISLVDGSGLDLLPDMKRMAPEMPILIVSMHPEEEYAIHAIRQGADGYINKSCAPEGLVDAVCNILAGKRYISASLASHLADQFTDKANQPLLAHETLSPRELQVLFRIGAGKTPTEIAAELFLSVKTISTYRTRVLEKMGLRTTAELMKYVISHNLLQ